MSSTLITDYLGYGTHVNRPTAPNVASGVCALYYETDTKSAYVWNGSSWILLNSLSSTPSIVQAGAVADAVGTVTLGAAPTAGNLLFAMQCDDRASSVNATGWNYIMGSSAGHDGYGFGWKVAASGESTTQTPSTTAGYGGVTAVWEVSMGAPSLWARTVDDATATPSQIFTTLRPNQLCLGICDRMTPANATPSSVSGIDHYKTVVGGSRSVTYFDTTPVAAGSQTVSLTFASSATSVIGVVLLG